VNRVDQLLQSYKQFIQLPWPANLAPPQRVWAAVYSPADERRLRLNLPMFEHRTVEAGYRWALIDLSSEFERWMASHEYREAYFESPELMEPELASFFDDLAAHVREQIEEHTGPDAVIGLIGGSSLFGLGPHVKMSALVEAVEEANEGRLLMFFPGDVEGNNFRLLGAQDGWNYHATVISAHT
jgi:hypothetical protein